MNKEEYDNLITCRLVPELLSLTERIVNTEGRLGRLTNAEKLERKYLFNGKTEQSTAEYNFLESVRRTQRAQEMLNGLEQRFKEVTDLLSFLCRIVNGWLVTIDRGAVYDQVAEATVWSFLVRNITYDPEGRVFAVEPFWIAELRSESSVKESEEIKRNSGPLHPLVNLENPFGEWSDARTVDCPACGKQAVLAGISKRSVPSRRDEDVVASMKLYSFCLDCLTFREHTEVSYG
jgi:hypothetical protein